MAASVHPLRRTLPALQAAGLALLALYLAVYARSNVGLQWDLDVYLAAADAALAGRDPYDLTQLNIAPDRPIPFPWIYPPVALLPFMALQALPHAAALWFGLKLGLLLWLVALWKRVFVPDTPILIVALMAFFASNGAGLMDLRAGNVAILETALVWSAFACFVHGRRSAFAALVVAAACFKLALVSFLLLLLVPAGGARPSARTGLVAALAWLGLVAGPFAFEPAAAWSPFAHDRSALATSGAANPGALTLLGAALSQAGVPVSGVLVAYFACAALLLFLSAGHLRRLAAARDAHGWIMAAVFLYLLLAPRPMAYGWILLGVAPFIRPPRPFAGPAGLWALAAILSVQGVWRALHLPESRGLFEYAPFLLALAIWLLVLREGAAADSVRPASGLPAA